MHHVPESRFLVKAYMYIMHHANVYKFLGSLVSKIGRSKGKYCEWQWQLKKILVLIN